MGCEYDYGKEGQKAGANGMDMSVPSMCGYKGKACRDMRSNYREKRRVGEWKH